MLEHGHEPSFQNESQPMDLFKDQISEKPPAPLPPDEASKRVEELRSRLFDGKTAEAARNERLQAEATKIVEEKQDRLRRRGI